MFKKFFSNKINLIALLSFAMPLSFATWQSLLNNFSIEMANFSGVEIGNLQSIREIPGFLAFTVVYVLLFIKQQRFAIFSLFVLGLGTALTGFFPTVWGLYLTTLLMSVGFHYLETMQQSLSLQWIPKRIAPVVMGKLLSLKSFAMLATYALLYVVFDFLDLGYTVAYSVFGVLSMLLALVAWFGFKEFGSKVEQKKSLVLKKEYWLFYMLTFLAGARRQIFIVFAGFLLVEKFGFSVQDVVLLHLANAFLNIYFARLIGRFIARVGEKVALHFEYVGLILIFASYAFVESAWLAIGLYILDHIFFAMAIAIKTYFQKIADPADIASSAGVSFTINHIAAVFLPALLGLVWVYSYELVFFLGASIAFASLVMSFLMPEAPSRTTKTIFCKAKV